jgi:hypothetical protein
MSKKNLLNWEKVVDQGFGDRHNTCAWSMAPYKDYLYVGTLNFQNGCQVFRTKTGEKDSWNQVNINGFDKTSFSGGARTMLVYNNLLWIVAYSRLHGSQVWVTNGDVNSENGLLSWKKVNINGFGEGSNIPGSRAMVVYKNNLYIGTQCRNDIPRIYRYDGPIDYDNIDPKCWTWINEEWVEKLGGTGDYFLIGKLVPFKTADGKEYLYAGIYSELAHLIGQLRRGFNPMLLVKILKFFSVLRCKIWRFDGISWEQVNANGFGKPNIMTMSSFTYNDAIYFGTTNVFGSELWKSDDGFNWNRVIRGGLGNPLNISVWGLGAYEERMVIGMQNLWQGGQIWMSTKENPESNRDFVRISEYGMDGVKQCNILKITQDGIKIFETFNDYLYAPTSSYMNIFRSNVLGPGCQIWRIRHIS